MENTENKKRFGVSSHGKGYAHILKEDEITAICNQRIKARWRYEELGPFTICPRCAAKIEKGA